ncbi:hypothetical protein I5P86_28380 [Pseudomonas glycinae]|uniref:hypothetical protein n=1 Tax=Pseudomonas glycinae TaxID=1785145 RepID=UPI0018D8BA8F|nr:hypothetical protein [Pseudomonas glycinae]MBH3408985.1 hypothetical protein [Pseudomonas glycinae]
MATTKVIGLSKEITDAEISRKLREYHPMIFVTLVKRSPDGKSAIVEYAPLQAKGGKEQLIDLDVPNYSIGDVIDIAG